MPDDTLDELREARADADYAERHVTELVSIARDLGYSWESIAQALGVTRQSAWERYGRPTDQQEH